ncbi:L-threonylcarbamoyladenylate synthase [Carnobacterium gallinarum]|uniref:L-threonylcarbamoyladenylate synthase n=1 Tax=Carnobacterium gallinarum TaxID=2749 RepID=UPI000556D18D|nr:L-threonylcarbamoyladenylate synthase [Carnobacterium gallinarum]
METKKFDQADLAKAAKLIQEGELIAFPTETVYGLGADALNEVAVKKVYAAKGRPSDNPLIVHVANASSVSELVAEVPPVAEKLMTAFWPGPLTMIFKAKSGVFAPTVTAGLTSVAIRMPDNQSTLQLIQQAGTPLVGPSANTSGRPSPTSAEHVYHDLAGKIAGIIDDGVTGVGLESTVVDITEPDQPVILRPGAVTKQELEAIIGKPVAYDQHLVTDKEAPKAPGMKYKHYAPAEPVILVKGTDISKWREAIAYFQEQGEKVGILANLELITKLKSEVTEVFSLGLKTNIKDASHNLYAGLRFFEKTEVTMILAEAYDINDNNQAYMNRIEKSSGKKYF